MASLGMTVVREGRTEKNFRKAMIGFLSCFHLWISVQLVCHKRLA